MIQNLFSFFVHRAKLSLILACLWTMLILVACFLPGNDLPKISLFQADKLVHIGLFGGCSFLWALVFLGDKRRGILPAIFAGTVCLGILVELIQSTALVVGRSGDFWDVVADSIGALIGVVIFKYLKKRELR